MWGGKQLILLAVIPVLVRCQQKPTVSMFPTLKQVFTGDRFDLRCDSSDSGDSVKWYLNDNEHPCTKKICMVPAAKSNNSGAYRCESNGQKSDILTVYVEEFIPTASLTIQTGQPVMQSGQSVSLKLEHEDGLLGWRCFVYRGVKENRIILKLQGNSNVALEFHSGPLNVPETIFWCADRNKDLRSNQVTVRTSDKTVSLEIYPLPAVVGENVILRCLVWGTDQISHTVFYRGDRVITEGGRTTFQISNLTDSNEGRYKCHATFKFLAQTSDNLHRETSDTQEILTASPMAALLSTDLSCSCPRCPSNSSYRYYRRNGQSWERLRLDQKPQGSGTYRCRAVWANRRTILSRSVDVGHGIILILVVVAMLVIAVCGVALCYVRYGRRNAAGPVYEDLPLRSHYETVAKEKEDDYQMIHSKEAAGGSKGGEYEALKAEGMKDGVYHTLAAGAPGGEGGAVAEGGYQALKKQGMKEGVYHTLGTGAPGGEGGAVAEGGYQALKKQGMKEGVYHTLGTGAPGGEGGPEASQE